MSNKTILDFVNNLNETVKSNPNSIETAREINRIFNDQNIDTSDENFRPNLTETTLAEVRKFAQRYDQINKTNVYEDNNIIDQVIVESANDKETIKSHLDNHPTLLSIIENSKSNA